jgi:hypothetical protein
MKSASEMKKEMLTEKEISRIFNLDHPGIQPDPSIQLRLNQTLAIKKSRNSIYLNSAEGFLSWIFSFRHIPVKATVVTLFFALFILKSPENPFSNKTTGLDTLNNIRLYKTDSAKQLTLPYDTCFFQGS